jgi:uncharacterized protein (TIGR03000 family)
MAGRPAWAQPGSAALPAPRSGWPVNGVGNSSVPASGNRSVTPITNVTSHTNSDTGSATGSSGNGNHHGHYRPYGKYAGAYGRYGAFLYRNGAYSGYGYPYATGGGYWGGGYWGGGYSGGGYSSDSASSTYPSYATTADTIQSADTTPSADTIAPADTRAYLSVDVPADAKVWVNDQLMPQTGTVRQLYSPPLTSGQSYTYEIRAQWFEDDRPMERVRQVQVHAGDRFTVNFMSLN